MSVDVPFPSHPAKKSSARLYKSVQRARLTISKMGPGQQDRAILAGYLGGPGGIRHPAVLFIWNPGNGFPLTLNEIEES